MATPGLAYRVAWLDPPRDKRSAAHVTCSKCQAIGKLPIVSMNNNPEKIATMFRRMDWECDGFHPAKNVCPSCIRKRITKRLQERREEQNGRALPTTTVPQVVRDDAPRHFEEMPLVAGTRKEVINISDLSRQQKAEVRKELDTHFNEETGQYEDGYSDNMLAEGLGIPRVLIAKFREDLYGPLLQDPEVEAFEKMMEEGKRTIANLQATFARMETRLDELRKKRGLTS